jgi:cyclophilin family peptidyl-prolyl cis-trans isomerase/glutaredoxin
VDAPVTILVYSDFQCPYCADLEGVLEQLREDHAGDVRFVFRHFPLLTIHDKASLAGQAAEAAGVQGEFWTMHDYLFERQSEWVSLSPLEFNTWLIEAAEKLGFDEEIMAADLQSERHEAVIENHFQQGLQSGLTGTPFIFINSTWMRLDPTRLNMEAMVRLELLKVNQYEAAPPMTIEAGHQYFARIQLETGDVVIKLLPDSAPENVNNFIFLANAGWFDKNAFFRVVEDILVETGDPSGTGYGNPGYFLKDEIHTDLNFDQAGMVAMSSNGPDTNGSQFFISLSPLPALNGSRTIFGRVVEGLDVLQSLRPREPSSNLITNSSGIIQTIDIEVR